MFATGIIWLFITSVVLASTEILSTLPFQNYDFESIDVIENANRSISYRLPNQTHPETYDISIRTRIDMSQFDFSGYVKINIIVDERTQKIVLHSRLLNISEVILSRLEGDIYVNVAVAGFEYNEELEFLTIKTKDVDLNRGERLSLEITYNGTLRTVPYGFYRSSYMNSDGRIT